MDHSRRAARRAQRHRKGASAPRRMLLAAFGTAGAIILGIIAGGGTFAVWSSGASAASSATVLAGSSALSLTPLAVPATDLYPGRTAYGSTTVRNEGTTPLALAMQATTSAASPFTSALVVSGGIGSSAGCAGGSVPPAASGAVGAGLDLATILQPGQSAVLCVGLGLPASAPAQAAGAAATPVSITISGTQVAS